MENLDIEKAIKNSNVPSRAAAYSPIFKLEVLFTPEHFVMSKYPRKPIAVFNPAAFVQNDHVVLLPRLIFDDQFYTSAIGICDPISIDHLSNITTINTSLLRFPSNIQDFKGIEDPRVTEDGKKLLWVALDRSNISRTVMAELDWANQKTSDDRYLYLKDSEFPSGRDAAVINNKYLLCRPEYNTKYSFSAPYSISIIENVFIQPSELQVVLAAEKWEEKVGFSTNVVKLSSNEYLVGWHTVLNRNAEYMNGFAVLNDIGEVLGTSNYILWSENFMRYGNRINTLFGCGLIKHQDRLYWAGGVGDWAVGIFSAKLQEALETIKYK